jgi:hypothetical protein
MMLAALVHNFLTWRSKDEFTPKLAKLNKYVVLFTHIQVTVGLIMLFGFQWDQFSDMGATMSDAAWRFKFVEHPMTMLIVAVLVTIGNAKSKRAADGTQKAKIAFTWFAISLFLVALRLPWAEFLQSA